MLIFVIKLLVALLLLGYLFSRVDWILFLNSLKSVNITLVVVCALMSYLGIYISILRWNIFLKNYDFKINKLKLYSLYSIGTFFNNFLPTTIGGDVYKFINLNKKFRDNRKEIIFTMFLERGSGFFSIFLINIFLIPLFYKLIISDQKFLFLEAIIFLGFIGIVFFIKNHLLLIRIGRLFKINTSLVDKFSKLIVSFSGLKNKKTLIYVLLYSFLFSFAIAISRWILFYAFGIEVNIFYILFVSTITQIFGLIPISLNSIGITEGISIFLFSFMGVSIEVSLLVTLTGRILLLISSSLGGIFYFFDKQIKY